MRVTLSSQRLTFLNIIFYLLGKFKSLHSGFKFLRRHSREDYCWSRPKDLSPSGKRSGRCLYCCCLYGAIHGRWANKNIKGSVTVYVKVTWKFVFKVYLQFNRGNQLYFIFLKAPSESCDLFCVHTTAAFVQITTMLWRWDGDVSFAVHVCISNTAVES